MSEKIVQLNEEVIVNFAHSATLAWTFSHGITGF